MRLNYIKHGKNNSSALVFIHGVGSNSSAWQEIIDNLPKNNQILTYDLRGHGASPKRPLPNSIDDFIDDHVRLLKSVGIESADLVGFSLGGLIAQGVALKYPALVNKLVLIGAPAGRTIEEQKRALKRFGLLQSKGPEEVARVSVERWYNLSFLKQHPDIYHKTVDRMKSNDKESYIASYRVLVTTDFSTDLHRIKSPTLAITGEYDVGSPPRMAELIASSVANGRSIIVPGVKHGLLVEQPMLIAGLLDDFLF